MNSDGIGTATANPSWGDVRARFLQGASAHPELAAHWDSRQEQWTFRDRSVDGVEKPVDADAERLFKETARIAVGLAGKLHEQASSSHVWLDMMRKERRGFRQIPQLTRWRGGTWLDSNVTPSDARLTENGEIIHVFKESAEFSEDLAGRAHELKPPLGTGPGTSTVDSAKRTDSRADAAADLLKLPAAYIDAANRETLIERECARSQLELMAKAHASLVSLGQAGSLEEAGLTLERECEMRLKNANTHIEIGTRHLFDAYADAYWHLVQPNVTKFSEFLPVIRREVERVVAFPELASTISAALDKLSDKWAERTVFQGAITGSASWSDLREKFQALTEKERQASKKLTRDYSLVAICDFTTSVTEVGSWIITGAELSIRTEFELHATASGIALSPQGSLDPLGFWLHRLFLDLLENRDPQATGERGKSAYIRGVCKASATFCARLETLALANEHRLRSTTIQPEKEPPPIQPSGQIPAMNVARAYASAFKAASTWGDIEIRFLSDVRVQVTAGGFTHTCNYAEFGFEDGRNHNPNLAWATLRSLAQADGVLRQAPPGQNWATVEKRIQEIRRVLRGLFGRSDDPVPYVDGVGYQACFKITCGPSFHA